MDDDTKKRLLADFATRFKGATLRQIEKIFNRLAKAGMIGQRSDGRAVLTGKKETETLH